MINREPTVDQMKALWNKCADFIEDFEYYCPESIYQRDRTYVEAPELLEGICGIVGYVDIDDEDDE